MSDERNVEHKALSTSLGVTDTIWATLPLTQNVHGDSFRVVKSFQDAVECAKSPALQEAASLAISILATSQISGVEAHDVVAKQVCSLTQLILTEPWIDKEYIRATVEILRRAEFLVKQQASSYWTRRGSQFQDVLETDVLASDIMQMSEAVRVLQRDLPNRPETRSNIPGDVNIIDDHTGHSRCVPCLPNLQERSGIRTTLIAFKKSLFKGLLRVYLFGLLNLPQFYASRLPMWARSTEPFPQTCPSRNSANSTLWMVFDDQVDCDVEFCDRVLTTLLREWKTLRVFSTIIFASVLAMLQISRVEADVIVSIPAYFSLICGIMAAVSATILDLYFQSGQSSPGILAWINSLRDISPPEHFNHDSVILAIPAISTAWCTILFIISIVAFVFQAYTGGADQAELDAGQHSIPMAGTLAFRIALFVFTMIGLVFLAMIFATLRRISEGWNGSASREGRAQNEPSCPRY